MFKYAAVHEHREGVTTYFFKCDNGPTIACKNRNRDAICRQLDIPFDGDEDTLSIHLIDDDLLLVDL